MCIRDSHDPVAGTTTPFKGFPSDLKGPKPLERRRGGSISSGINSEEEKAAMEKAISMFQALDSATAPTKSPEQKEETASNKSDDFIADYGSQASEDSFKTADSTEAVAKRLEDLNADVWDVQEEQSEEEESEIPIVSPANLVVLFKRSKEPAMPTVWDDVARIENWTRSSGLTRTDITQGTAIEPREREEHLVFELPDLSGASAQEAFMAKKRLIQGIKQRTAANLQETETSTFQLSVGIFNLGNIKTPIYWE